RFFFYFQFLIFSRALSFDKLHGKFDAVFSEAARSVQIDLYDVVNDVAIDDIVMWIDPGSVVVKRVQIIGYHTDETELILYSESAENGLESKYPMTATPFEMPR